MKKVAFSVSIVLASINCMGQKENYIDSLKNTTIPNCKKLELLKNRNEIDATRIFFFIEEIEKLTGITSSLVTSENGLIYLKRNDFMSDIIKWEKKLKCKRKAQRQFKV